MQHAPRRSPDEIAVHVERVGHEPLPILVQLEVALSRQQSFDGHLEDLVDLVGVHTHVRKLPQDAHERNDEGRAHMSMHRREGSDDLNRSGWDTDLLEGLPEGRCSEVPSVLVFDESAGEAHLPWMPLQVVASPREQDRGLPVKDEGCQDCREAVTGLRFVSEPRIEGCSKIIKHPATLRWNADIIEGMETTTVITVTAKAADKARALAQKEGRPNACLRVRVVAGGCSGFSYELAFEDSPADDDNVIEVNGFKVLVDPTSAPIVEGSTLEFKDSLLDGGLKMLNPQAVHECACGESFSI